MNLSVPSLLLSFILLTPLLAETPEVQKQRHENGTARLRYEDLTPHQRTLYGISKAIAQSTYQKESQQRLAYEKAVLIQQQERALQAKIEAQQLVEATAAKAQVEQTTESSATASLIPNLPVIDPAQSIIPRQHKSSRYRRNSYGYSSYPYYFHSRNTYPLSSYQRNFHHNSGQCLGNNHSRIHATFNFR